MPRGELAVAWDLAAAINVGWWQASGRSNRTIAQALLISPSTVLHHVSRPVIPAWS